MNEVFLAIFVMGGLTICGADNDLVRVLAMMHMQGRGRNRLLMPRLMRTPRRARHDKRADEHKEKEA